MESWILEYYAAQANAQIDTDIGQKDHLSMETNSLFNPQFYKHAKELP
jgi:hypothetical protein